MPTSTDSVTTPAGSCPVTLAVPAGAGRHWPGVVLYPDAGGTRPVARQMTVLDAALTAAGVEHTIEWYSAAHGFAVPDNATYDAAAAQRHWAATQSFFGAHLRPEHPA